ncbi:hypothetical protein RF11_16116 [Thelohanellus kitauei]|uniref:Uncharacterized protein n=1 Tax=Thelohanellus kitauei TaxID=669202 RepID=A0A0C2IJZ2_THEKT|nr:hypothetical protein RF11_16116 [Thelohanellus kitauei]
MDTRFCTLAVSQKHFVTPLSHHMLSASVPILLSESLSNITLSLSERIDILNRWIETKLIKQSQGTMAFILAKFHAYLKTKGIFFRIGRTIPTQTANVNERVRQKMLKKHFCVDFPIPGMASCQSVGSANGEGKTTSTRFKCLRF